MNPKPELSISDDYAVLRVGKTVFYYGYEWGRDHHPEHDPEEDGDTYGFSMTVGGEVVVSMARPDDGSGMAELLLRGIGYCVATSALTKTDDNGAPLVPLLTNQLLDDLEARDA